MNETDFVLVKQRVRELIGIDLEHYKEAQVRRRLDSYLSRTRQPSWNDFFHLLGVDPEAARRFRDYLTINVTSFFRDAHKWLELERVMLPLIRRNGHALHAWSAGCSHGEEAYSLALLFERQLGMLRYRVLGTDIDREALAQAQAGGPYLPEALKDVPPALLSKHFRREGDRFWIKPATLRGKVTFAELDLLNVHARQEYDLVLCRNVLIYFTEAAKAKVIEGLAGALRPGGILFIGSTESIPAGRHPTLERVGISFYRRLA